MPYPRPQRAATVRPEKIQLPIVEQNFSKEEQGNEMTGLFTRGCLKKVKQSELPMGTRVISSSFQYKIGICNYGGLIDTLLTDVEGVA